MAWPQGGGRIAALLLLALLAGCATRRLPPPPAAETGAQCLAGLEARGVAFERVRVPVAAGGCGIATAVRVRRTAIPWNQPALMSCALAARLDDFERDAVQPAARRDLGHSVKEIEHYGAYACRNETGGPRRLSQHAFGNAIDIAGFILDDGTKISIAADWRARGRRGAFLHDVARRACSYFSLVLTPASNSDHRNHFHLDVGPWRRCEAP